MTWTINITGHDDLSGDEKAALEQEIVQKARQFASELVRLNNHVTTASVTTNTTGSVNLLS